MADSTEVIDTAAQAIKDALTALEAEELRLTSELATVKTKVKDMRKAHETLTGSRPTRRRGRPRKNPEPVAA